jgi:hypothetical protein
MKPEKTCFNCIKNNTNHKDCKTCLSNSCDLWSVTKWERINKWKPRS